MRAQHLEFEIDDDSSRVNFDLVHSWLTTSYWSPGVSRERVERAAAGSASVAGVYLDGRQVAYCRVVSDKETFAWLCDVWVDESVRGRGIGKAMVRFVLSLPYAASLRKWVLATQDAHEIYASCGFELLPSPERWMILVPPQQ